MNKELLNQELKKLGVVSDQYSLLGELIPDSIVLYNSYQQWHVFYLDERGTRHDTKVFDSEANACEYIYKIFKESKEIENKSMG